MPPLDRNVAEGVVRESLGLSADDLGMNPSEDAFSQSDLEGDFDDGSQQQQGEHQDQGEQFGYQDQFEDDLFEKPQQKQQQQQQQPQQRQEQPKPKPLPSNAEVRVDQKGNLVDRKTGQIVARAGGEARMYQKLHKTNQAYQGLQAQHSDLEGRLNKAIDIGTEMFNRLKSMQEQQSEVAPTRYGLSNSEAIEAMNFAKEAKTDPVGTIKKLLTKAAASGIDLTSIGLSGGNFDPKALMELVGQKIDTAMNPLRERSQRETAEQQQQREANERAEEAKSTLNTFLAENPDAKPYLPAFHKIYSQPQFQHMPITEVWARIQLNLMKRAQEQAASPPQRHATNQTRRRNQMPRGQRMAPGEGLSSELAPVNMSYDDIVRGIMGKQ